VDWPRPKVLKKPEPEIVYTRQISGLKVLPNGTLLIASAIDPGISGPFVGAIYEAGRFFKVADKNYRFVAHRGLELKKLYTTGNPINKEGHKIEGIEPLGDPPGKLVMVTDDENCGPSIAIVDYPPSAV
jgi:hypothetical protein